MKILNNRFFPLALLQISILIYSGAGICAKMASRYSFASLGFIGFYVLEFMILAIYAVLWQQVIKRVELSVAYSNRALQILWSLIWAVLIFGESITLYNVFGIVLVAIGTFIINSDSPKSEKREDEA